MLWVFAGQMLLILALFGWNDLLPSWLNRLIATSAILFPPLAYLTVLAGRSIRQAWLDLLADSWSQLTALMIACVHLLRPATTLKLVRSVAKLKPMPTSMDEWITSCILPFKVYVLLALPVIYIMEKATASDRWESQPTFPMLFQWYLLSLGALILGALLQAVGRRPGRVTTTLQFFILGVVFLFLRSQLGMALMQTEEFLFRVFIALRS